MLALIRVSGGIGPHDALLLSLKRVFSHMLRRYGMIQLFELVGCFPFPFNKKHILIYLYADWYIKTRLCTVAETGFVVHNDEEASRVSVTKLFHTGLPFPHAQRAMVTQ